MKRFYLFVMLLCLFGANQMEAQIGGRGCAKLVNVQQICEADGTVTLSFHVYNNTSISANQIQIVDGNGVVQIINAFLPAQSVTLNPVIINGAIPLSTACFIIRLSNSQVGFCESKVCLDVIDCIGSGTCATVDSLEISCVPAHDPNDPDDVFVYSLCFEIFNPANSNNFIDRITISAATPDVCINNNAGSMTMVINPVIPGGSRVVCVTLTGCNAPLQDAIDVDFTFDLFDTNDPGFVCSSASSITTPCCGTSECTEFTIKGVLQGPDFERTIVSGVQAEVNFELNALDQVPDQLIVEVNGLEQLNITPGKGHNNCNGMPLIMTGKVFIQPCDIVEINVEGDKCGPNPTGEWRLTVSCIGVYTRLATDEIFQLEPIKTDGRSGKRITQNNLESLVLFPNPVNDVLHVRKTDSNINYESVNVMDNTGRILLSKRMSGKSELQLDTSKLPQGTYLLEITDDEGVKMVEKFIKLN